MTRVIVDGVPYAEYRFAKSSRLRLTVNVDAGGATNIRITGRPIEEVQRWKPS